MSGTSNICKIEEKKIEKFHNQLKEICKSRSNFKKHIDINKSHILERSIETGQAIRRALTDENIAAITLQGCLNLQKSKVSFPLEIAIEATFTDFLYIDWSTNPTTEKLASNTSFRVIIREKQRTKHFVLSVYVIDDKETSSIPEVNYEIW